MGGRWSLVQIQSPRPFFLCAARGRARPTRHPRGVPHRGPAPGGPALPLMLAVLAYAVAETLVRALPEAWSDHAARRVSHACHAVGVPARGALERNLSRLQPLDAAGLRERSRRTFEQFALVVTDFL